MGPLPICSYLRKNKAYFLVVSIIGLWCGGTASAAETQDAFSYSAPNFSDDGEQLLKIYEVKWLGIPEFLQKILERHIELAVRKSEGLSQSEIDLLREEALPMIEQILKTEGYFNSKVDIQASTHHESATYEITITLGPAIKVESNVLRLEGNVRQEKDSFSIIPEWIADWNLPVGSVWTVDKWEKAKILALQFIQKDRFPLAQIKEHRAEVDPRSNQAELFFTIDSGPVAYFGNMTVEGMGRYPEKMVRSLARFKDGDPFREEDLLDFQSALEQDQHFSSVIVGRKIDQAERENEVKVNLEVKVEEFQRQKFDLGLLWDREEGFGLRSEYTHYNILKRGWVGAVLVDTKHYNPKFSLGLVIPKNSSSYSYLANVVAERQRPLPDWVVQEQVDSLTANLWQVYSRRRVEIRWGMEVLWEKIRRVEGNNQSSQVSTLNFVWQKEKVDRRNRPKSGYRVSANFSTTLGEFLAKNRFDRVLNRFSYWWTPPQKSGTFLINGVWGEVWTRNPLQVPSSKLFLAGGGQSVRGYEFQAITTVEGKRGTRLLTGSLEYQHPIGNDWSLAVFTDVGTVAGKQESMRWHPSYGMGLRWYNSLAPLQLDIAKGVNDPRRFRWYLGVNMGF
jgi:translocation and assembly module TamA